MNNKALSAFLHLSKRGDAYRLGSDYLTLQNSRRIKLILHSSEVSEATLKVLTTYSSTYNIPLYNVPANIIQNLYPGKSVKVLSVTSGPSAKKIANLMKEGESYE